MSQLGTTSRHWTPHPGQAMPTALLVLGDAPAEASPHTGLCSHGANDFEELGVNALFYFFPPLSLFFFFFLILPPFLSQLPTGSKRPFAVVKATVYHEEGAVKWQQPRALLSISAASLVRPWLPLPGRCSARAPSPWDGRRGAGTAAGPSPMHEMGAGGDGGHNLHPSGVCSACSLHPTALHPHASPTGICSSPLQELSPHGTSPCGATGAVFIPQSCCVEPPGTSPEVPGLETGRGHR